MCTFLQRSNARRDSSLIARTEAALLMQCRVVRSESEQTPSHADRLACANACCVDEAYRSAVLSAAMVEIAASASIAANPGAALDADIEAVIGEAFTMLALTNAPA